MIPGPGGLEDFVATEDPFDAGVSVALPFPQVFRGRDLSLLFSATTLRSVDVSTDPWSLSAVATVDPADGTSKAIPTGGAWHFVDLGPSFYAFNGNCTVYRPGLSMITGGTTTTYVNDSVTVKTGCEFRGRVYVGGFDSSDFFDSLWGDILTEFEAEVDTQELNLRKEGLGSNWILWSSIGGGDFPLWLMLPKGYSDTPFVLTKSEVITKLKQNGFGWYPLRHAGDVTVMKPLGDFVIVYGSEGIEAVSPRGDKIGFRRIANFGVLGRGSVAGTEQQHVFLDGEGNVWRLTPDLNLVQLGYKEWFSSFPATSTVITHNPVEDHYYLSSPSEGFILTPDGLAEHNQRLTSLVHRAGYPFAVGTSAASTDIRVKTGALDLRRQALKTIHDIQVDYSDIDNLKIEVEYRNDHTSAFRTIGAKSVGPEGVLTTMLTAREFKIRITGTPLTNPRITGLEVRWNLVDKRAVRGQF